MSELKFHQHSTTKNPKYLVIFLHGYGSNGENLIGLSQEFLPIIPDAHFISPNAVEPWEGGFPNSYQWFSLYAGMERKTLVDLADNIKKSNQILQNFINSQLEKFNLTWQNLFLAGFSQGAMMAIYQGLISQQKPRGIISYSGKVILPEMLGEQTISKPEICLIHGEIDSVLPFENFLEAKKILSEKEISFESHAIDNLDHSIDIRGIKAAQKFIKKIL